MKKVVTKKVNLHIKVGDQVKVISGFNKGKIGLIKQLNRKTSKIIVEGVNIKVKHIKPSGPGKTGQIKELEFPIHSSNVLLYKD